MLKLLLFGLGFMIIFYGGIYLISKGILKEDVSKVFDLIPKYKSVL